MGDQTKTGKGDDFRINVNQTHELQYWSEKFSVSKEQLRAAVTAVGPIARDVAQYLQENKNDK